MRTRAYRRHKRQVAINKAIKVTTRWSNNHTEEEILKRAMTLHQNRTPCSCDMCGNPRRSPWTTKEKRSTIQERRNVCDQRTY